jgi:hypothetical protein
MTNKKEQKECELKGKIIMIIIITWFGELKGKIIMIIIIITWFGLSNLKCENQRFFLVKFIF